MYRLIPSIGPASEPARYAAPGPSLYRIDAIGLETGLDELLTAGRRGLESVAADIGRLLEERRRESGAIISAIDRDQTYLENLILDRYRHGERPTDDQTYVRLREHQLKLESERRREQSSLWRDTVLLAKELSELHRRVDEARHRERLFGGEFPDP